MKNWPASFRSPNERYHYASFRGFPFEVEREGVDDAGRLVALHQFVKAENHATEDMGRKARRFVVTAYIANDHADLAAARFVEVCSRPGFGRLVLPMTLAVMARCIDCSTLNEKARQGYVAFALRFIEAGLETGGFPAIQLRGRLAAKALGRLPGEARRALRAIPF